MDKTPSGFTVTVQHEITRERVGDLLCNAFEGGGSNYWYRIEESHAPSTYQYRCFPDKIMSHIDYPLNPDGYLVVSDYFGLSVGDHIKKRKLSYTTIKRGLRLLSTSTEYVHHWHDFLAENDDATTGDVFLQLCLFGDPKKQRPSDKVPEK